MMLADNHEPRGTAHDARVIRRFLGYVRPYRRDVAIACGGMAVATAAAVVQPYLIKSAIDQYIAAGRSRELSGLALLYVATLLAAFAAAYAQTCAMQVTGQRVMADVRAAMYRHLQRVDMRFYDLNPVGRLVTRVTSDVDAVNDVFTSGVVTIVADMVALAGIVAAMTWVNWRLAAVTFATTPLVVAIACWFRRRMRRSYRLMRSGIGRLNTVLHENIAGMATVQMFRREALNFARFDEVDRHYRDVNIQSNFYHSVFYPAIEAIGALSIGLIVWYGGARVIEGALSLGGLVAFLQYSQRFFRPIIDMSEKVNVLELAIASLERIFAIIDEPINIESNGTRPTRAIRERRGHIRFERVWFAYANGLDGQPAWVLRDVSFEVRPGEHVGIAGTTGSGKTTLVQLLLRFYDAQRGRIIVDGVDVREWPLAELRSLFGVVSQDVHLFAGTIADNISLGDPRISDERVRRAARTVGADTFIARVPGGYDAPVAPGRPSLAAGQKQLLSLARAFAFEPTVLILDEATSSIDLDTEMRVRESLTAAMHGRTTVAIAHRVAAIRDMDKILVFHNGVLRESGTHRELVARHGLYHTLTDLQCGPFEETACPRGRAGHAGPDGRSPR